MINFSKFAILAIGLTIGARAGAVTFKTGTGIEGLRPEKIQTFIGDETAENTCYFVMCWNDSKGIENIAFGVKFQSSEPHSPADLLEKAYTGDRRFYKDASEAYCFDLNGDNVFEGETVEYDHRAKDGVGGEWSLTAPNSQVENGDVIFAEFVQSSGEKGRFASAPLFYLPPADTPGSWIAEGYELALADEKYDIPVYINACGNELSASNWAYYTDAEGTTQNTKVLTVTLNNNDLKTGKAIAQLTTKGEGTVYIRSRIGYKQPGDKSATYSEYSYTPVTITPAERPVTGISWNLPDEKFQLSHSYMLADYVVLEPADATYTGGLTYKLVESDPKSICGVSSGKLSTRTTPGSAKISVTAGLDKNITATAEFIIALVNPVTKIDFKNIDPTQPLIIEFDPYKMEYNNTSVLLNVEPENADISKLSLQLIDPQPESPDENGKVTFEFGVGNGVSAMKYDLVSTYQQNDGAYDLMAWGFGETKACFTAQDGSEITSPEITIKIVPRTMDITDNFCDGTFWLNEDWFGHSNGSINYLDENGDIHYRVYNYANFNEETPRENRTFGCTSQFGMIFGDRLYVMSKQNHDGGDRYQTGGGRLVIADAKTLKRLHSFDVIGADESRGGDGRACVGVSADKVYIGHHAGIRVLNIDNQAESPEAMFTLGKELNFTDDNIGGDTTPGNSQGALYSNQVGDMVYACGHVFAVMQDRGLLVIDTATDTHIETLGDKFTQAVTQSADGNIWYASNNTETGVVTLHCINPETLEEIESQDLPEAAGTINTGWGAWRSANFFASRTKNVLFWGNVGSGYQDDILGKGTGNIYRWEIGQPMPTEPFFSLGDRPGKDSETFQRPYATMRYDDRFDRILMATTHGASYNYRYNWIYFINGTTGEIERVQETTRYFWFPAIPIFPDKHEPVIAFDQLEIDKLGKEAVFDLSEYISDQDNISRNINLRVEKSEGGQNRMAKIEDETTPDLVYSLKGQKLHLTLNKGGNHTLTLVAESNGKEVSKNINIIFNPSTGTESIICSKPSVYVSDGLLKVINMEGIILSVVDITGTICDRFEVDRNVYTHPTRLNRGLYIISGNNGFVQKVKID